MVVNETTASEASLDDLIDLVFNVVRLETKWWFQTWVLCSFSVVKAVVHNWVLDHLRVLGHLGLGHLTIRSHHRLLHILSPIGVERLMAHQLRLIKRLSSHHLLLASRSPLIAPGLYSLYKLDLTESKRLCVFLEVVDNFNQIRLNRDHDSLCYQATVQLVVVHGRGSENVIEGI